MDLDFVILKHKIDIIEKIGNLSWDLRKDLEYPNQKDNRRIIEINRIKKELLIKIKEYMNDIWEV